MASPRPAPEWDAVAWLNTDIPLSLTAFRGRPVIAAAFQMLCPGCVSQTIPQLNKVRRLFDEQQVAVLGLHSVFEHHAGMQEPGLRAFLHEYGVRFPVAIDRHEPGDPVPVTMRRYQFQGTPTLLLIDHLGRLRRQTFGHLADLQLGAEIASLIGEADTARIADLAALDTQGGTCTIGAGAC